MFPQGYRVDDWTAELERGAVDRAWDAFLGRYRRLIFAAIRRYAQDYDDVMDVFARVCEALRENDLRRLRSYRPQAARFSTWLVTVVHRLTIDWYRHRDGRPRPLQLVAHLSPLRRRIFELVFLDQHGHVGAYEIMRTSDAPELTFREFLAELRATYRAVTDGRRGGLLRVLGGGHPEESAAAVDDLATERREQLDGALGTLSAEDQVLLSLYVEQELPAADIARMLGLANAKAVYNRAYRALAAMREYLEAAGIRRGDL